MSRSAPGPPISVSGPQPPSTTSLPVAALDVVALAPAAQAVVAGEPEEEVDERCAAEEVGAARADEAAAVRDPPLVAARDLDDVEAPAQALASRGVRDARAVRRPSRLAEAVRVLAEHALERAGAVHEGEPRLAVHGRGRAHEGDPVGDRRVRRAASRPRARRRAGARPIRPARRRRRPSSARAGRRRRCGGRPATTTGSRPCSRGRSPAEGRSRPRRRPRSSRPAPRTRCASRPATTPA